MKVSIRQDLLDCADTSSSTPIYADSLHVLEYMKLFQIDVQLEFEINKKLNQYCR